MAQALLQHMLAESGLTQVEVRSAGTAADSGAKASPFAEQALQELDIDLTNHRAQALDTEMIGWADLILTMTQRHKEFVTNTFPAVIAKTHVLKEFVAEAGIYEQQQQALHKLHGAMAIKQEAFAAEVRPNISELRARRSELLQELTEVEQLLAERQSQLLKLVRKEREEVEHITSARGNVDIADPFGQPFSAYRASRDELKGALSLLMQHLQSAE